MGLSEAIAARLRAQLDPSREADEETNTEGRRMLSSVDLPESDLSKKIAERLKLGAVAASSVAGVVDDKLEKVPGYDATKDAAKYGFTKVVDILSRGQYMMAAAVDSQIEERAKNEAEGRTHNPWVLFTDAMHSLKSGAAEALSPQKQLSFIDVLKRHAPEFVEKNPTTAWTFGMAGDILLDPLNLIGVGEAKSAIRVTSAAGKALAVDKAIYRKTFKQLLEATGEGVATGARERLVKAVGKLEPGEEAMAKQLDELLAANEAAIHERWKPRLAEIDSKFEGAFAPDGGPELAGFEPHRKPAPSSGQQPLFDDPGKAPSPVETRDELLRRRNESEALYRQELADHLAMKNRVDNAIGSRNQARLQVLQDFLSARPTTDVIHDLVKDTAEKRMAALLDDPAFVRKVKDRGGVKVAGVSVISSETGEKLSKAVGYDKLRERLKELADNEVDFRTNADGSRLPIERTAGAAISAKAVKLADGVMHGLNRNWRLPEEFVVARTQYESALISAHKRATREAEIIFGRLPKEGRDKVNAFARRVDDMRGTLMRAGRGEDEIQAEIGRALSDAKLSPEEFSAYARMRQQFQHFRSLEQELGLLEKVQADYHPVAYRLTRNATAWFGSKRMFNGGLGGFVAPAQARVFIDEAAAKAAGYDPVTDAMALYTLRATQHQRAVATELFRQRVEDMFDGLKVEKNGLAVVDIPNAKMPVKGPDGKVVSMLEAPKSATMGRIARDLTYIGEGVYSPHAGPVFKVGLPLYDKLLGFVRKASTVVRPSFAGKQLVSNQMQSYLGLGWEAFRPGSNALAASAFRAMGALDPRATLDASLILTGEAGSFGIVSALGQKITGVQMAQEAMDHGVVRGITLDGVGMKEVGGSRWVRSIEKEAAHEEMLARWRGAGEKVGGKAGGAAMAGFRSFVSQLARYTDFPAKIEDFSRMTLFVNARRMGYSAPEAAKLVNQQLFDYMHGLSQFEARGMRRFVPFWSYRRFAVPMIAKVLAKTPGRVANLTKATDKFFEVYGKVSRGESLTDDERFNTMPGWVMEQPHAIAEHQGVFQNVVHTFNGFSPMDVLSEFMPGADDTGKEGTRRWIEKAFLSQLAPYFKVPLEMVARKEFFSGRSLEGPYKRNIKNVDPDVLLSTLAAEITMTASGNTALAEFMGQAGAAAGAGGATLGLTRLAPKAVEKTLQVLLGWEKAVDPRTGKEAVYVSPWRWNLAAGFFPPLNDAAKFADKGRTPLARTRHFLFGVNELNVDSQKDAVNRLNRLKGEIADKKREYRQRGLEQAVVGQAEALKDLQELYNVYQEEADRLSPMFQAPQE